MKIIYSIQSNRLRVLDTHLASRHSRQQVTGFESLLLRSRELFIVFEGDQPETGLCFVVVAMSFATVTFNEWRGTEIFEAGTWSGQRLTTTAITNAGVLKITRELVGSKSVRDESTPMKRLPSRNCNRSKDHPSRLDTEEWRSIDCVWQ